MMASRAKVVKGAAGKQTLRAQMAKQRRNQNLMIGAAAAILVLLIGFVVYLNVRGEQPVAGETQLASQGNMHIEFGSPSPIAYNSVPPTSGPHYGNLVGWGIYQEPQRYEHLVHNLEDGGVVIYYQCPDGCPEIVQELEELVQPYIAQGRHIVLAPNDPAWSINNGPPLHQDMGARIALTAWQRVLKLDEVDSGAIRAFIQRYEGIDHHVAGTG
jgi:hypothetical protein